MPQTYRQYIEELLQRRITEGGCCFVFPSEVTAEWMQRGVLRSGGVQALRRDRFISWDRFKEALFSPRRTRRPVNAVYRSLFTSELLREHAEEGPLFTALLGETRSGSAARFRGYINTMLPTLKGLVEALAEEEAALPEELKADFRLLHERYAAFLELHGLYEPSFEEPRRGDETALQYEIFYPELLEDYREYAPLLDEHPRVRVHPMERDLYAEEGEEVSLSRYDNAAEELEALLDGVERRLEEGVSPLDMAITLPDFEGWRGRLEEAAALRQIPLSFRTGRPLAEHAAGRFFRRAYELHRSGYDHARLKDLFLDPAYPWRERGRLRRIIDFGVEHHCLRGYRGQEERYDPWQSTLSSPAGEGMEEELRLLNRFRTYLRSLAESPSAAELLSRLTPFLRLFLDPEGWDPEEERALQYTLLVLRELAEAEEHCGFAAPNPFSLWLSLLEEKSYVHAERRTAVPVYRYRVSAGIVPHCHFIAGAGQQETRCRHIPFPFLREDRRGLLGGEEADASAAFLRAYAASGEEVYFSCSNTGFSSPQLPPVEFYTRGLIAPARRDAHEAGDRFAAERSFWSRAGSLPQRLYRLQREGFARMLAAGFSPKGSDYTGERIEDGELRSALRGSLMRERDEETLWLSPTRIEQLKGCPFVFFIEKGLRVEEVERQPQFVDYRILGVLYHRIFGELLQRIDAEDGAFNPERLERYAEWAEEIVRRQFGAMEAAGEAFLPPVWNRERERAVGKLRDYLGEEAEAFAGYRLAESEREYTAEIPGSGVGLTGRIDRHSVLGEESAVVDYKSGGMPRKSDVASPGEEPPIVQLPVYVYLLEEAGREVHTASYYSVKESRFQHVYTDREELKKGWMSREYLDEAIASVCRTAVRCAQAVNAGDLQVSEECDPCEYRGLCRYKFRIGGSPVQGAAPGAAGAPAAAGAAAGADAAGSSKEDQHA